MFYKVIVCCLAFFAFASHARVMLVNMEKVAESSNIMRKLNQRLKRERADFDSSYKEKKDNLEKKFKELESKRKVAKTKEQREEVSSLEKKLQQQKQDLQKEIESKTDEMQSLHQKALSEFETKMQNAASEILANEKDSVILPSSYVIGYSTDVQDVTNEMIEKINKED